MSEQAGFGGAAQPSASTARRRATVKVWITVCSQHAPFHGHYMGMTASEAPCAVCGADGMWLIHRDQLRGLPPPWLPAKEAS